MTALVDFENVAARFIATFGAETILSILAYGSRVTNPCEVDSFSDFDMTVVFKDYPQTSLEPLPPQYDISTYIWKDLDDLGLSNFHLDGKGIHSIFFLASAIPLYGPNPFVALVPKLDNEALNRSFVEQVIEHCWKLGNLTIYGDSQRKRRDIIKYSFRIAKNMYLLTATQRTGDIFLHECYSERLRRLEECPSLRGYPLAYLRSLCGCSPLDTSDVFRFVATIKRELKDYCTPPRP